VLRVDGKKLRVPRRFFKDLEIADTAQAAA
jgi:hypothetical protein